MRTSKVASWIVIGVLVLGGGVALAETMPENPEVVGDTTEEPVAEEGTAEEAPETETESAETEAGGEEGEAEEGGEESGEHPDNHGTVVSAAAHDHSHDEACGNHGKVVSAVAKTGELPECATAESGEHDAASADAKPAKAKAKAKGSAKKNK